MKDCYECKNCEQCDDCIKHKEDEEAIDAQMHRIEKSHKSQQWIDCKQGQE